MVVVTDGAGWRKRYYLKFKNAISRMQKVNYLPTRITLPVSSKNSMFELGGSWTTSGIAMLIATSSGFPNSAIALKSRRKNGLHAASRVWPGCLIGIASHKYGKMLIAIYRLEEIHDLNKLQEGTDSCSGFKKGVFKFVTGIMDADITIARKLDWISPFDRIYAGIKKLANALIDKVVAYECTIPYYIEPFRAIDESRSTEPKLAHLLKHTNLSFDNIQSDEQNVSWCNKILENMAAVKPFIFYSKFEQEALEICSLYAGANSFVYLLLCHCCPEQSDNKLQTFGFVCYQRESRSVLKFHSTGLQYQHTGLEHGYSSDLQSYIARNYNPDYFKTLFGINRNSIKQCLDKVHASQDKCSYVLLRHHLSEKRYRR